MKIPKWPPYENDDGMTAKMNIAKISNSCFQCALIKKKNHALNKKSKHLLSKGKTQSLCITCTWSIPTQISSNVHVKPQKWPLRGSLSASVESKVALTAWEFVAVVLLACSSQFKLEVNNKWQWHVAFIEKSLDLATSIDLCCLLTEERQYNLWNLGNNCMKITVSREIELS